MRVRPVSIVAFVASLTAGCLGALAAMGAAAAEPIVVHSAASDGSFVSRGVADMLSARLEQTGRVSIDRVDDPGSATTRLRDALRVGKARSGDYVVFGAFTQFGDGASLDIHCIPLDVKSEAEAAAARRIFIQSGAMGEIIPKLDEIVDRLAIFVKAARGSTETGPGAAPPAAPAPARADADALRKLSERIDALEKAVYDKDESAAAQRAPAPES
jgi:hypothetical protein